ncbi:MAG: hypothetical protein RJB66_191 [Pseudomonadota bacterium]|jgi:hypothetical protein
MFSVFMKSILVGALVSIIVPRQAQSSMGDSIVASLDDILYYQRRYPLKNTSEKFVDNQGEGFEELYGARNFRAVLNGVMYRGGANNKYNKYGRRDNRNPLPEMGLKNFCQEGFGKVYYMYSTNYDKKQSVIRCNSERSSKPSQNHQMDYKQLGPWEQKNQYQLLKVVYDSIMNPQEGPVYFHCWNGWHASGLISALTLRQFCDFSGDEAVRYWDQNTDGNNDLKAYEAYRQMIRSFSPFQDLKISQDLQRLICPAD